VYERLYELRPAQSGVEELNSSCKFIQAGRQSLLTTNSRYLTYLYVNRRLLVEYHGAVKPAAGSFRLGCHWPPTSVSAEPALDDAVAEAALEKEVITLDASIAALDAADEEALRAEKAAEAGAAAKPRESPRLAKKSKAEKRAAGRKRAREAQQLRKAGRAGRALAKEEGKRAKKAAVVSSESESESDSGASDDDDSHAIELDDDSDDSTGARSGEGEE
jgi:hypothetical protein